MSQHSDTVAVIPIAVLHDVHSLIAKSGRGMTEGSALRSHTPVTIRAGRHDGLPFDSLTTDLYMGCLPASQICYGSCFAARGAPAAGYDFGSRVENMLDVGQLQADLLSLPQEQRFLRNGWNSDASWNWPKAYALAKLIREAGRKRREVVWNVTGNRARTAEKHYIDTTEAGPSR
ncbi:TPA: hypothetical protein RZC51_001585 [Burkholderia cenocepacia]|nr:hypothetical protein [Burkholderia cenocepacia]